MKFYGEAGIRLSLPKVARTIAMTSWTGIDLTLVLSLSCANHNDLIAALINSVTRRWRMS